MSSPRTIDVLIPVFNGAPWLRRSVDSIRAQTHRDLRIHVVDDGSTDATPQILAALAAEDARIVVHRQANGGIVEALNHGLDFCTADWLARHDADDEADPHRLATQLDYLSRHADCVAVGAAARHIDASGRRLGTLTLLRPPEHADAGWLPAREPYLMHPMLMARRDALAAVGGYRHSPHSEDSDLYWRLRRLGRLHNLLDVLGDYRMHGASVSGGSIVNGRVMAVGSQLAALSQRRCAAGLPDIAFDRSLIARLRDARTLRAMVDAACSAPDAAERAHFELAVAAKLVELAAYQPFELDEGDVAFVAAAMRSGGAATASAPNRRELGAQLARTAVRLARAGRRREALGLLPVPLLPQFLARLVHGSRWVVAARRQFDAWRAPKRPLPR